MRTRITTLLIVALTAPALAASAQTVILADHNRRNGVVSVGHDESRGRESVGRLQRPHVRYADCDHLHEWWDIRNYFVRHPP